VIRQTTLEGKIMNPSEGKALNQRAVTHELARYIVDLRYEDLPPATIAAAKEAVLDQLGIQLMGSTLPWTQPAREVVREFAGRPEATIVGHGDKAATLEAAFVNANQGHSCEMDDTGYNGGCHPSALTVPPALALAEHRHLSGRDLLLAVVTGYEIITRIGSVITDKLLAKGFHHQSVVGPFGAAAVAGKLSGLNAGQMVHALSIAGSHASGTMEYDQRGGEVKRLHSAIAVRAGMLAVLLARKGLTGPDTILEGLRGIPRVFVDVEDVTPMVHDLDRRDWYAIQGRIVKPYPACGAIHTPLQALTRLMQEHGLTGNQVQAIDVHANTLLPHHGGSIYEPKDTISAQFSLAFSMGLRLTRNTNDLAHYLNPQLWTDPEILRIGHTVKVHVDQSMTGPTWHGARVCVTRTDGTKIEAVEPFRKGSPDNPLTSHELEGKFRGLARAVLPEQGMRRVVDAVNHLDEMEDVATLASLLVKSA